MNLLAKYKAMVTAADTLSLVVDDKTHTEREKTQKRLILEPTSNISKTLSTEGSIRVAPPHPEIVAPAPIVKAAWVNPHAKGSPEAWRHSLQEVMDATILTARDRIIESHKGRQYRATDEIKKAEQEIERLQHEVLNGQANLADFQKAVIAWERVSLKKISAK